VVWIKGGGGNERKKRERGRTENTERGERGAMKEKGHVEREENRTRRGGEGRGEKAMWRSVITLALEGREKWGGREREREREREKETEGGCGQDRARRRSKRERKRERVSLDGGELYLQ
jgi:hypothetical protein